MRLGFVEVKYKRPVTVPDKFTDQLPKKVILFLNVQYHNQYENIKKQLETAGKDVVSVRPKHAWYDGQILGCSTEEWDKGQDAFVYIGDGLFHPKAILFNNTQPVYMYDPKTDKIKVLEQKHLEQINKQRKGALASFYASTNIGVLITTKYGQMRIRDSLKLQERFPEKTFYFLIADVIDFSKLEDFPFLECFVNTACPRIMDDNQKVPRPLTNIGDLGVEW
ncbi:MAG: diphthamide synthesis protein [Candidatus Woesearchaeota archaeon]|nr:diphthamide synthesis protein [Candidatus Woesearchaeota archaeon]